MRMMSARRRGERSDCIIAAMTAQGDGVVEIPGRHGGRTLVLDTHPRRRVAERDRQGRLVAACRWEGPGTLASAVVRTSHGDWIGIEPRAAIHTAWGVSDRLWRVRDGSGWEPREPLTIFESLSWGAITHIPPLAEPAALPPGAGTAVLNLVAALAQDQGVERLRYRGPYATEQLFAALLESFQYVDGGDNPLRRFLDGALEWTPAPHERSFPADGICVQLRDAVEKVVFGGRAYYREAWQSVKRHAPRQVRDAGDLVVCSLTALGAPVEDHLVLTRAGDLVAQPSPRSDLRASAPLHPRIHEGVTALLRATSAPALDAEICTGMGRLALEWGGVTGDLVELGETRARLSWRLAECGAARLRSAPAPGERLGRALEVLTEMARRLEDTVRARAQAALAARPAVAQRAALERAESAAELAPAIAAACAALAEELGSGGCPPPPPARNQSD
jgi:hypothetical protein